MTTDLQLINGEMVTLDTSPTFVAAHFENIQNCTGPILAQTNTGYYDRFITPDDKIIIDLGANIGLVSMHLAPYADKVIAVEPTPSHFTLLEYFTKNIPNIVRVRGAVSDRRGKAAFYTLPDSTENSLLDSKGGNMVEVDTYTLEDIIDQYSLQVVDFVKIDIEGSELQFLSQNNIETLNKYVKKFFIEFHYAKGKSYTEHREYYRDLFASMGWTTELINVDVLYCYRG
jgi:FkbM family methyltransferase